MKLSPLSNNVVIKPFPAEENIGRILLPDVAKRVPCKGHVVAAGPGLLDDKGKRIPPSVKKGDVVIYPSYTGTNIEVEKEELIIMRESEILAVVEKE